MIDPEYQPPYCDGSIPVGEERHCRRCGEELDGSYTDRCYAHVPCPAYPFGWDFDPKCYRTGLLIKDPISKNQWVCDGHRRHA